jgi:hypothetical protein
MKLTKKEQIDRIAYIMSKPEFTHCEIGHIYLPLTTEAENECPICKKNFSNLNNIYCDNSFDQDLNESLRDYLPKERTYGF